jgi:chemotaxis receptor (MCP) glutamine deamidase CheD
MTTRISNISHCAIQNLTHHRVQTHAQTTDSVRVATGDVATSKKPVVMRTILGSCVAVCLYDPSVPAGGMNHILLPGSYLDGRCTRLGVYAMELLINELMKLGGDRRRFVAKAFGGANVMRGLKTATIGDDNAEFVRKFLAAERIPMVAERLGGNHAVEISFSTDSGKAVVRSVDGSQLPKLIRAEDSYRLSRLAETNSFGEITLF